MGFEPPNGSAVKGGACEAHQPAETVHPHGNQPESPYKGRKEGTDQDDMGEEDV